MTGEVHRRFYGQPRNGFVPTIGDSFTFLNAGVVNGTVSIFDPNIDDLPQHWEVSFFPTFAVLTVAPGNVSVPDQGSTFVLLMLGLLGVVMYRQCSLLAHTRAAPQMWLGDQLQRLIGYFSCELRFQFHKRRQLFIGADKETLSFAAVRVCNPD
jgi:hypothetical protein